MVISCMLFLTKSGWIVSSHHEEVSTVPFGSTLDKSLILSEPQFVHL